MPPLSPGAWLRHEIGDLWEEEARGVAERASQQWAYAQASVHEAERQAQAERALAMALEGHLAQSAGTVTRSRAVAQQAHEAAGRLEGRLAQVTASETQWQTLAQTEAELLQKARFTAQVVKGNGKRLGGVWKKQT